MRIFCLSQLSHLSQFSRLSPKKIAVELLGLGGSGVDYLASKYNISPSDVVSYAYRYLSRANYKRLLHSAPEINKYHFIHIRENIGKNIDKIAQRIKAGEKIDQIAEELIISENTLEKWLKSILGQEEFSTINNLGVINRSIDRPAPFRHFRPPYSSEVVTKIISLYRSYVSKNEIARQIGSNAGKVSLILQQNLPREEYLAIKKVIRQRNIDRANRWMGSAPQDLNNPEYFSSPYLLKMIWQLYFVQKKDIETIAETLRISVMRVQELVDMIKSKIPTS